MCGIAGICRLGGMEDISVDTLLRMTCCLDHRGPDEKGIYIDDNVGLGHSRLSIIDLSGGVQPIHNEDGTVWIVYNGEVFNYLELREKLLAKGHRFYTSCDTEVVVHMYEEYGAECLEQLNGQFAFVIWDSRKHVLFAGRDRMGIRPFHYTVNKGMLYFSSEIKGIFQAGEIERDLDKRAIDEIFTFWTTIGSRTAFKGISELPPGHYMTVSAGKVEVKRYWDIPYYPKNELTGMPVREICSQVRQMLSEAVSLRLRADVPVASYLSGGLDSSGLTSLVVKNFNRDVRTFGIRFEESAFDEGKQQEDMVRFLGARHCEIHASNERIGSALADVLWHAEKPILRTSPVPLYLLSRLVRQSGMKVVITGEGADEVFGGYNIFREAKIRRFWARQPGSAARRGLIGHLYPYIFKHSRLKNTLENFFAKDLSKFDDPLFSHMLRWGNTSRIKGFFSEELKERIGNYDALGQLRESLPEDYGRRDYFAKAQYLEMGIFMSNYLLSSQGDRVAMANSVEIRLPYLDPNIVEFMAKVPAKWKILGLNEKHVLKKAFSDILPESITSRSKHPYRAPIAESLLSGRSNEYINEMLSENSIKKAGLFDGGKVGRLVGKIKNNGSATEIESMGLVGVLSCQMIYDRFIENFSREEIPFRSVDLIVDRRKNADTSVESNALTL